MSWPTLLATADRAVRRHLGGPVTYTPSSGEAVPVTGIFDAAYVRTDAGEAGVSGAGPAVFLTLADLPSDPEVDEPTVTVDGTTYKVREAKPDGQGGVLLLLHARD